jgi:hypothetical protein
MIDTKKESVTPEHHAHALSGENYYGHDPEPKNIFLTIRLTQSQMSYLNCICEDLKTSKSALIKNLIFSLIPE